MLYNSPSFEMTHIANGTMSGTLRVDGANDDDVDIKLTSDDEGRIEVVVAGIVADYLKLVARKIVKPQ